MTIIEQIEIALESNNKELLNELLELWDSGK